MELVLNDLYDYKNMKIYQYRGAFKFSLDSILLAEYVKLQPKTLNILDICSGNCAVPLILSTKTDAYIDAFEIQAKIYEIAQKSIEYNKLDDRIKLYNCDALEIDTVVKNKKYDIITCNPPYFKVEENNHINVTEELAIARHELKISLEDIFRISSMHLDDKGELYLVHRVQRLDEIIILGNKYRLNVKNIQLIKTKANGVPYIVLVRCVKNSKLGIKINDIINIEHYDSYQDMFKEEK